MSLSIGIVGLPNAGKSTLFNTLRSAQGKMSGLAEVANYPFTTIEPNKGIVPVPDERLAVLAKIVQTEKQVPALVEFVDIAGLVKGASQGEGLGNKFLSHIREVSVICYVLRFFEDPNVIHVANRVNPEEDLKILEEELILADLQTLEKQREPKMNSSKTEKFAWEVIQKLKKHLNSGLPIRTLVLDKDSNLAIQQLNFLTIKPVIYVANMSEKQLTTNPTSPFGLRGAGNQLPTTNYQPLIKLSAKLESELIDASPEERKELLNSVGIKESALDQLAKTAYQTLNLISFLTAGALEARAWSIKKGTTAQNAAGVIHTDFIKKFIKADIVTYEDYVSNNGWLSCRQKGLVRSEGKDYIMQEGDVVEFKIGG